MDLSHDAGVSSDTSPGRSRAQLHAGQVITVRFRRIPEIVVAALQTKDS